MMDWNKIEQLLNIGHAAADHGPKYTPIVSAVQLELEKHVDEAKKVVEDKTKADAEEAGRQRAEAENKARAEAAQAKAADEAQAKAKEKVEDQARVATGDATTFDSPARRI
jgi:membrane protein involved in colicin uptake